MFGLFNKNTTDQEVFEMCIEYLTYKIGNERAKKEANHVAIFIWAGVERLLAEGIPASHFANIAKAEAHKIMKTPVFSNDDFINSARNIISSTFFKSIEDVGKKNRSTNFISILDYLRLLAKPEIVKKIYELLKLDYPEEVQKVDAIKTCSDSNLLLPPIFLNDVCACENCGFVNKKYYFRSSRAKKASGLADHMCPACGSKIFSEKLEEKLNPQLIEILKQKSIEAYKNYYSDYEIFCKDFNKLEAIETFEVMNGFQLALSWLVTKYESVANVIGMTDENFSDVLEDLSKVHGRTMLASKATFFIQSTLCFWKYCPCLNLEFVDNNWDLAIGCEGCDVQDSEIKLALYSRHVLNPAEAWPFPTNSRP